MLFTLTLVRLFYAVSHNILIDKGMKYGLDKWTVGWAEKWLNNQAQKIKINVTGSRWRQVVGYP